MDDLQIQSVTRIRYVAHECLRDHARSSTVFITDPQNDVGKRIREKERVRRREIGKRRRKDDPEQYYAVNMNVHSQLYDDDDDAQLYHVDGDVNNHLLSIPANAGDDREWSPIAQEVIGEQLCEVTDDVDCDITDGVDELPSDHAADKDECKLSHVSDQNMPPGSHATVDVVPQSTLSSSEEVARQNDFSVLA
ncbi:unnamed protein product [Fraxinus pennsylvanica]|uniref:Uncharacterized protein n=1 Tax=Fraxinus pennsylvanica TaxID=56036 RepID=A0AAD2E9H7_9LAMI|nr:unnamed protein product [Fraxinus pennsylvanica]